MEQMEPNHSGAANFEARTITDIIEPAKSIFNKVSVKGALDEMQARAIDSSPVIDQRGELLGTVSKNKMNREVGGPGQHSIVTAPADTGPLPVTLNVTLLGSGKKWVTPSPLIAAF